MAKVFVDTNLLIYAIGREADRRRRIEDLLYGEDDWIISSQVAIEFASVCLRKKLLAASAVQLALEQYLSNAARVVLVDDIVIFRALALHERYSFSWWDSLIVAAALEAGCVWSAVCPQGQVARSAAGGRGLDDELDDISCLDGLA